MKNTTFNAITKEESEVKKQYDIMPKFQLSPSTKHLVLQIKNSPNYSREEEYALFEAYKAGDQEAYDSLFIYGTKFVMYHAKRLSTNEQGFEDYVSAGYKGLHDAIVNFDISKGFRLCTYANSKIVKEINLYISQNFRQITVPKNLNESFSTINRIAREKGIKLFTDEEKEEACKLSKKAGADFVKTSTGFNKSGATPEDIALMRKTVGPKLGVKASGGVRDTAAALEMIKNGATRIGASASIAIIEGLK